MYNNNMYINCMIIICIYSIYIYVWFKGCYVDVVNCVGYKVNIFIRLTGLLYV